MDSNTNNAFYQGLMKFYEEADRDARAELDAFIESGQQDEDEDEEDDEDG